jgi:hypothetical protein
LQQRLLSKRFAPLACVEVRTKRLLVLHEFTVLKSKELIVNVLYFSQDTALRRWALWLDAFASSAMTGYPLILIPNDLFNDLGSHFWAITLTSTYFRRPFTVWDVSSLSAILAMKEPLWLPGPSRSQLMMKFL